MDKTNMIVVPEERQTVEKIKGKKNKIQQAYQEKVVDTGISDKVDKGIDTVAKVEQVGIGVIGGVATVALAICPADGPVGEACTLLATPALIGAVQLKADIEKKVYHTVKGAFEKKVMQVDKENDNVVMYNDQGEVMNDFMSVLATAEQLEKQMPKTKGVAA
jgi:hypothetical protein